MVAPALEEVSDQAIVGLIHHQRQPEHRATPVYADGNIYLTARDGYITVIKAGREFEVVAENSIPETMTASPVFSNGVMYLRTYDALYAVSE